MKAAFSPSPVVVVTAASAAYAGCVAQLLRNLSRRGLAQRHRTIVWDLGLNSAQRELLVAGFPWAEFRAFDFPRHPPHVAVARNTYARSEVCLVLLSGRRLH